MAPTNSAAILDAVGAQLRVGPVDYYRPGKGEVLIEVHAVAINPADAVQQLTGILIDQWPTTLGCDAAGKVVELGEGVTHVSVGSRVLAQMTSIEGQNRGAFQKYVIAPEIVVSLIPDSMSFHEACVIPLCLLTGIAGLHLKQTLGLPWPSLKPQKTGKTLLVWGGAASVGCMAIQLAVASGVDVITTSSPKNFDLCKRLGASEVFDYTSSTVVEDVKKALQGRECAGAFEASGKEDSMKMSAEILSAVGGGFLATAQPPIKDLPSNVKAEFMNAANCVANDAKVVKYVYNEYLPAALQSGQFKPAPEPEVVGKGLEFVQVAFDAWRKGVSARKIVVEL